MSPQLQIWLARKMIRGAVGLAKRVRLRSERDKALAELRESMKQLEAGPDRRT